MTRRIPLWSRNICRPMSSQAVQSTLPARWPRREGQRLPRQKLPVLRYPFGADAAQNLRILAGLLSSSHIEAPCEVSCAHTCVTDQALRRLKRRCNVTVQPMQLCLAMLFGSTVISPPRAKENLGLTQVVDMGMGMSSKSFNQDINRDQTHTIAKRSTKSSRRIAAVSDSIDHWNIQFATAATANCIDTRCIMRQSLIPGPSCCSEERKHQLLTCAMPDESSSQNYKG